jgi:hypothetical protein
LGEGSIEKGLLRCPWHGYDYDPLTGRAPGDFADKVTSYDVEERDDGVYVRLPERVRVDRTVADVLVETLVAHGVTRVFGMVGHSNLGFAEELRRSQPVHTASSPVDRPHVSRSPGPGRPTCSPACTTPSWTSPR